VTLALVRTPGVLARTEDRLSQIGDWMAQGLPPRAAASRAQKELGLSRRQADAYVSTCLRRLAMDSAAEPVESKRARVVAMLHESIASAKAKRKQWYEESTGRWEERPDPDHKAVATLLGNLVTVEGLANVQAQANVLAEQEVERTLSAIRSRCTADEWAPVARAVKSLRDEQAGRLDE
jgi:hypothetical protein